MHAVNKFKYKPVRYKATKKYYIFGKFRLQTNTNIMLVCLVVIQNKKCVYW